MSIPTIAIVGQPNVGKSTIFNRIAGKRISIVDDIAGVTRDRIYSTGEWLGRKFNLIDTGGIDIGDEPFINQIEEQAEIAINESDAIIFIVNAKLGITSVDEKIARILRKTNKPIFLAINKVDNYEMKNEIYDFYSLGFKNFFPISGVHGIGIGDLLDSVVKSFPINDDFVNDSGIKFSFIGRPNVGKSSLFNSILGENRVIVSDIGGTTRDSVDTIFKSNGIKYTMIDTAGIRKKGKIYENTEKYSLFRAMSSINRSDVSCVVLNAAEGIREQDKHIAGYAHDAGCGVIIIVNKWDLIIKNNHSVDDFKNLIRQEFQYLKYAPIIFVSAKTRQRLKLIPDLIQKVNHNHEKRIASSVLNEVILDAISHYPTPSDKGKRLRIYYATQVSTKPPTFVIFTNIPEAVHFSYKRFLENQIRSSFDFTGTPIRLIFRKRK